MLGLFMFRDSFANIVMITFTALIMIELLNVYSCVSFNISFCLSYLTNLFSYIDSQTDIQNDADASSLSSSLLHFYNAAPRVF